MISVTKAKIEVPWNTLYALAITYGFVDVFVLGGVYRHDIASVIEYTFVTLASVYHYLQNILKEG